MEVQQGRPLIAVADGIEAERQALRRLHDAKTEQFLGLFERLILVSQANSYAVAVLRWLVEHGGLDGGAELDAKVVAADPWVMASDSSVRRALRFWESVHGTSGPVLRTSDRIDKAGRLLSRVGLLDLSAVKSLLLPEQGVPRTQEQGVPQTDPPSNRQTLRLLDGASVPQTDPPSNRHPPDGEKQKESEAEFQARQRLIAEELRRIEETAQDSLHDHGTIDIEERSASCHSTIHDHDHDHGGASSGAPPVAARDSMALASPLETRIARFADPREQKRRLVARIQGVVGDPLINAAIPRIAADLVVFEGVPLADLEHILVDLEAMREAGSLRIPGAFFLQKAREMAGRHGKPWPDPKESAATTEGEFS